MNKVEYKLGIGNSRSLFSPVHDILQNFMYKDYVTLPGGKILNLEPVDHFTTKSLCSRISYILSEVSDIRVTKRVCQEVGLIILGVTAFPTPSMPKELFPIMRDICCAKYVECSIEGCNHPELLEDSLCYIHRRLVNDLEYSFLKNYEGDKCLHKGCTNEVDILGLCRSDLIKLYNNRQGSRRKIFYEIKDYLRESLPYCYECDKFSITTECSFCGEDLYCNSGVLNSIQSNEYKEPESFYFGEEAIKHITNANIHHYRFPGEYMYPNSNYTEEQLEEFRNILKAETGLSSFSDM